MTASIVLFDVSEAIIANVPGTNVVTTQLEHPSAFDGCAIPAEKYGKELRVAQTDPVTGTIPVENVLKLIDQDTCLLSVIMTSNITGAVLDIETIAREAHKIKPDLFIVCDSVQHTPHGLTDMKNWGLDCVNFAPYKFGGARGLGVGWLSERTMNLPHRKLIREKQSNWEMGGCAPGMYAMLSAIFNYVCWIGGQFVETEDRRALYVEGMNRIMLHERALLNRLLHISNIEGLFKVIQNCVGKVELVSDEGDCINLKSRLAQYMTVAGAFSDGYLRTLRRFLNRSNGRSTCMQIDL